MLRRMGCERTAAGLGVDEAGLSELGSWVDMLER